VDSGVGAFLRMVPLGAESKGAVIPSFDANGRRTSLITAAVVFFIIVKPANKLMALMKKEEAAAPPPAPAADIVLLTEIRDLLKNGKS
jgi:hypothetical protein